MQGGPGIGTGMGPDLLHPSLHQTPSVPPTSTLSPEMCGCSPAAHTEPAHREVREEEGGLGRERP